MPTTGIPTHARFPGTAPLRALLNGVRAAVLVLAALPALAGAPAPARAHSFTVTRVELIKDDDRFDLTLWLGQQDLLQNVLGDSTGRTAFADVTELRQTGRQTGDYVQAHVEARVDGRPVAPQDRRGWPPDVLPTADDARGAAGIAEPGPPRLPMTLRFALPPGARRLTLKLSLYNHGEFVSLYDVTARQSTSAVSRTDYVRSDQELVFDLADAALADPVGTPRRETVVPPSTPGAPPRAAAGEAGAATPNPMGKIIRQFLVLGFTHIVPMGLDHILFVLGLFLLAPGIRPLLKQVTAFTVAHSLTLGLAMLGIVHLSSRIVEPLIALSIAVVAVENIFSQKVNPARWMIVFGFGLIHGLGFAGVLAELGVPRGQFLPALLSFNVGVEFGQLAVILAAALLTLPVIRREWYHRRVTIPASLCIAGIGLYWAVTRALGRG